MDLALTPGNVGFGSIVGHFGARWTDQTWAHDRSVMRFMPSGMEAGNVNVPCAKQIATADRGRTRHGGECIAHAWRGNGSRPRFFRNMAALGEGAVRDMRIVEGME